ncbi:Lrp/AsnC ligand binding domain-containing protein [Streptomyces sp. NPDC002701]|uniref:Lrp/AsnC ligand binding domain-containing protein n=1 Tax=Streptomyces sp. NPDC002701 TaxID=3364661 RepID=UPI0036AF6AAE
MEPTRLRSVGQVLAGHREVRFAAVVSGEANVVVSVLCRTTEELLAYLTDRAGSIRGVRAIETVPTLRQVKALTYEPRRCGEGSPVRRHRWYLPARVRGQPGMLSPPCISPSLVTGRRHGLERFSSLL